MKRVLAILMSVLVMKCVSTYAQLPMGFSLCNDEIVIETFTLQEKGRVEYMASVLKSSYDAPHVICLFNETKLAHEMERGEAIFTDTVIAAMLLNPLKEELDGVKKIFFIPSGKLHLFAIEYCNAGKGQMLADKYDFYRLTTSNILTHRDEKNSKSTSYVIFGGIDFDMTPNFEEQYEGNMQMCRYGYLQDSYEAALNIHNYLTEIGFHGMIYANEKATESAFKTLPWKDIRFFLIETHGVVVPKRGKRINPDALMLAGASYVMEGGIVPTGAEDGLLTIEDITNLDMSHVDLAVISACKSALGGIDNQGVKGLMSAFKAAGVNSLVMTTDDVVDYVSGEVWKEFFRNIANGMSKRESLLNAVKHIKTIHDGFYSSPKFWTPFVLIDGTN